MSLGHGSSIVKDNLLFYYDIANTQKSWRGLPITNVVSDPNPLSAWTVSNFSGSSATIAYETENNIPHLKITGVVLGTSNPDYPRIVGASLTSSVTDGFSVSFEAKGTPGEVIKLALYSAGSTKIAFSATLTGDWQRFTFNNQTTGFTLDQPYIRFDSTIPNSVRYIRRIQVEQNTFASPFVVGTRSNTQALLDLTGRNTITATNLTYASNNTFSFDGVDDYLDCGSAIQLTNDFTLEVWHKNINTGYLIDQGNIGSDPSGCLEYLNRGLTLSFNNIEAVTATGTFQDTTTWNSVACTFSSGTVNFYINGTYDSTKTTTTRAFIPSGILKIGRRALATSLILSGEVSNVKIYGRVLSAAEIRQNFEALRGRYEI